MKTFAVIVAGAALVASQALTDLPACGQTCIGNMLGIAQTQFGCASGNVTCYCTQPRFGYGVRDCAEQACQNAANAQSVISYGTKYCETALAQLNPTPTPNAGGILSSAASGSGAGSASSTATVTSTVTSSANSTASATGGAAAGGIIPVDGGTSGYKVGTATITAGGAGVTVSGTDYSALPSAAGVVASAGSSVHTTITGSSALGAIGGIGGSATSGAASATSAVASGESSAASSLSSVASSASSLATSAASAASSHASAATAATSTSAAGAMGTAVPALFGAAAFALLAL